jgi:hypothetical protein
MDTRYAIAVLSIITLITSGCGEPDLVGPTISVAGKVTVEGKPIPIGNLVFKPDASKGNTTKYEPVAFINPDGSYKIKTGGKDGAPAGWYKVAIEASELLSGDVVTGMIPKSYINKKYNSETTSELIVEVKAGAAAGAYDFDLKK